VCHTSQAYETDSKLREFLYFLHTITIIKIMKGKRMKKVKFNIYFKIIATTIVTLTIMNFLVPRLLDYPPFSNDADFQVHVETIPHTVQYLLLGLIGVVVFIIGIPRIFKNVFKYLKIKDKSKLSFDFIKTVRHDCLDFSRKIIVLHIILLICVLAALSIWMKPSLSLFFKMFLIYFSFFTFISVISISLIKRDLDKVIHSTYEVNNKYSDFKRKYKFSVTLIFHLVPFFLVLVITIAMLGYAQTSTSIGEGSYYYYKLYLQYTNLDDLTFDELTTYLNRIPLKNEDDYYFIIKGNKQYFSKKDGGVSEFFIKYADAYLDETNGRVYEYYGIEEEAYVKELTLPDGNKAYVGFKFSTMNRSITSFFLDISITFIIIYICILLVWSKNISKSLSDINNNLAYIAKYKKVDSNHVLAPTSLDEIGELTITFNNIQKVAKENLDALKTEHEKLIENERLASLGQLIGGIAHNLKTPIMSVSGAAEGLSDLIKEYEASIGDSDVTPEDHREITKEMNEWIEKIKTHMLYMSDIITTVKGQAVTLSEESDVSFDLEELVKRVSILMKHELKYAHVNLNTSIKTKPDTVLNGNIVSLVQVINNMISNSIEAYNGEPNKDIDLIISKDKNNIIISIKDYGPGLPKNVENKLFKEMTTTKGKKGTGLGLFMSYSTIKARFNGNITFETEENKGTTFNIIIPLP